MTRRNFMARFAFAVLALSACTAQLKSIDLESKVARRVSAGINTGKPYCIGEPTFPNAKTPSSVGNSHAVGTDAPAISSATWLSVAAKPYTSDFVDLSTTTATPVVGTVELPDAVDGDPFDTGIQQVVKVNLTNFVRDMLAGKQPTTTFVVHGPHPMPSIANHFTDNDLKVTWYEVKRLRVIYAPSLNPRAPQ